MCRITQIFCQTLLVITTLLVSCGDNSDEIKGNDFSDTVNVSTAKRTVIVYMAAQNSLGMRPYKNHLRDSTEIMKAYQDIPQDSRLLLFIDDQYSPRLYRITRDTSRPILVKKWIKDEDSASSAFFTQILLFVKNYFPSDEYGVVMWSHATGWLPVSAHSESIQSSYSNRQATKLSFGIDDGMNFGMDDGTEMSISDMAEAFGNANFHAKYLFFDACLMQNVEVAYELRHCADFIVASPMSISSAGANYTHQIQKGLFSDDISDIASTYVNDVLDKNQVNDYGDFGLVISVVKTSELDNLSAEMKQSLPNSVMTNHVSPQMGAVLNYQAYSKNFHFRPHNYDMAETIRFLFSESDAKHLLEVLDKVVVYKDATTYFWIGPGERNYQYIDINTFGGISMFVPQEVYTLNASACTLYGDLNKQFRKTSWYSAAGWDVTGW